MKHLVAKSHGRRTLAHFVVVTALLLSGTACQKSVSPIEGDINTGDTPVEVTPEGAATGLLTRISLGNNGLVQQVSYNSRQQPIIIIRYAGSLLTEKDSVTYSADGRMQKVLHYTPDFFKKGKFILSGNTSFEWNNNGRIARKLSYDLETNTLEEDIRYSYDAAGQLASINTTIDSRYSNLKIQTSLYYEANNVTKVTHVSNGQLVSQLIVTGFDKHATFVTHPLLPYLLDITENDAFSGQNALQTKSIQYVNLNNKKDSIVTVTKNSFQYNAQKRPVKNIFTSTIYSTGNQQPVTSSATIDYSYGK